MATSSTGGVNIIRFLYSVDNKQALVATREYGDQASKTANQIVRGNREQRVSNDENVSSLTRLRGAASSLAGYAGLAGIAFGIKDIVEAGIRWRADQAQLISSLRATGNYSVQTVAKINDATAALSTHGGFADVTQSAGVTRFITQLGSVNAALKANAAVTDVARRLQIGYAQAQTIVARANTGAVTRLQQYLGTIIPIHSHVDALTGAEKRLYPAMYRNAQLEDKRATAMLVNQRIMRLMGTATAVYGRTAEGSISNAENSFQLLEQFLGSKVLPAIKVIAGALASVALTVLNDWPTISGVIKTVFSPLTTVIKLLGGVKTLLVAWAISLGMLVAYEGAVKAMVIATYAWNTAMEIAAATQLYMATGTGVLTAAWTAFTAVLEINPIILAMTALALVVAVVITHWKQFKQVAVDVFNAVKTGATTVVGWIVNGFNTVVNFIASIPGRIAKIAVHLWDGLWGGLRSVADAIIRFINSTFGTIHLPFGLGSIHLFTIGQLGVPSSTANLTSPSTGVGVASSQGYQPQRSLASATPTPAPSGSASGEFMPVHVHMHLGGRQFAEEVTRVAVRRHATA